MKRVSLKDIANQLEISESLVSKVLSGRMGTSTATPKLRRAIHATADRLGYKVNRSASALAAGKQGVIGVFVHLHGVPGSNLNEQFMIGLAGAAAEHKQRLWLNFYGSRQEFNAAVDDVNHGTMDGLIVAGVRHDDMVDDLLGWQRAGIPVVTVLPEPLSPELVNVGCSDLELCATVTQHLLAQGRRHLAHIVVFQKRTFGYRYALERAGITPDPALMIEQPLFSAEDGRQAVAKLLERRVHFDGLVCQSDHQAYGAIEMLRAAGKRVPQDVAVVGIDDSPICDLCSIPITSVSQNFNERGRLSVDTLMSLVDGENETTASLSISPNLHVRASTRGAALPATKD